MEILLDALEVYVEPQEARQIVEAISPLEYAELQHEIGCQLLEYLPAHTNKRVNEIWEIAEKIEGKLYHHIARMQYRGVTLDMVRRAEIINGEQVWVLRAVNPHTKTSLNIRLNPEHSLARRVESIKDLLDAFQVRGRQCKYSEEMQVW